MFLDLLRFWWRPTSSRAFILIIIVSKYLTFRDRCRAEEYLHAVNEWHQRPTVFLRCLEGERKNAPQAEVENSAGPEGTEKGQKKENR